MPLRRCAFLAGLLALPLAAQAEELWVISAGDEFAYLVDVDSIVTIPGDIRQATVHQIYFVPRDVGEDAPLRAYRIEMDFDCIMSTYQQRGGVALDDDLQAIGNLRAQEPKRPSPGTNAASALDLVCADAETRPSLAAKMDGNATLEEAYALARRLGNES